MIACYPFGVKSTWQVILAQLSVLVVFLVFLGLVSKQRKNAPVTERSEEFLDPGVSRSKLESPTNFAICRIAPQSDGLSNCSATISVARSAW